MTKNLKPVDKGNNPGLAKLPTEVRNKMGYMKKGGSVTDKILTGDKKRYKDMEFSAKLGKDTFGKKGDNYKGHILEKLMKEKAKERAENLKKGKPKGAPKTPSGGINPSAKKVKKKDGGMVLEIGLRPATKSEMKMAKKMKKPVKKANGGMARGTGAAISGKGFRGVF